MVFATAEDLDDPSAKLLREIDLTGYLAYWLFPCPVQNPSSELRSRGSGWNGESRWVLRRWFGSPAWPCAP